MNMIEGYYGRYTSAVVRAAVAGYIADNYNPDEYDELFKRLVVSHPSSFKVPPDVSVFHGLRVDKGAVKVEALRQYKMISSRCSVYKNAAFEDIRSQAAIDAMGGLVEFCNRDPKYEHFHRNRFLELFLFYTENPPLDEYRVMQSIVDICPTVYIGDESRIKALIGSLPAGTSRQALDLAKRVYKKIE